MMSNKDLDLVLLFLFFFSVLELNPVKLIYCLTQASFPQREKS